MLRCALYRITRWQASHYFTVQHKVCKFFATIMEKRVRKKSKRLSESSAIHDEDEPPRKKSKRVKSAAVFEDPATSPAIKKTTKSSLRNGSKKPMIVKVDFTNNDNLKLGGVPLSQLGSTPARGKGQRTRRSVSLASSHSNSILDEVTAKPEKMNFKNPKFCVSYDYHIQV